MHKRVQLRIRPVDAREQGVGAFALYTLLMALFTNPVIDAVKNIVT